MDLIFLIKSFNDLNNPKQLNESIEILQELIETIQQTGKIIISNLDLFFEFLNTLLNATNIEIINKVLIIIQLTIKYIGPELEIKFVKIVPKLVTLLADPKAEIRKETKQIFINFIKKTRNSHLIIKSLLDFGLKSKHTLLRLRSLKPIIALLECEKTIFFSNIGVKLITQVLENIIVCYFDNDQNVRKKAEITICELELKGFEGFNNCLNNLALEHRNIFMKIIENHRDKKKQEKFLNITIDNLKVSTTANSTIQIDLTELKKEFYLNDFPVKKEEILIYFPKDVKKNLYFALISEELLLKTMNFADQRDQSFAIQEVANIYSENSKNATVYISSFYKYILYLLKSTENFQIITNLLNVLNLLLNISGIKSKIYLPLLASILIEKCIEERVFIRNQIVLILKKVMKILKPEDFLQILTFFLFELQDPFMLQKKNHWHLIEEGLYLLCILFLDENLGLFSNEKNEKDKNFKLNFKDLLIKVSSLLDHKIQKVRKAAMETLAVICISTDKLIILEILHEILSVNAYEELLDKLEKGNYFYLNKNGILEMNENKANKISTNENNEPANSNSGKITPLISQDNENSSLKNEENSISGLIMPADKKNEENIIMTQREKNLKRNEEFEKMVLSEDMIMREETQMKKNEIYVSIARIPITNPEKELALLARTENNGKRVSKYREQKIEEKKQVEEKQQTQNSFFSKKENEEFSILYTDKSQENKPFPKDQMKNISKIINENKNNYMSYKYDEKAESEIDQSTENYDVKARLPFEETKTKELEESLLNIENIQKLKEKIKKPSPINTILPSEEPNQRNQKQRPDTREKNMIKDSILKDFLNFGEDRPLWSPSKPKFQTNSPIKYGKSPRKKKKNDLNFQDSEENIYFMSINDLMSLDDPIFAMHRLLLELKSNKWEDNNNALLTIRRLAKHHKEQLYDMNLSLPHLISDICELAFSMNSIVCKHSILTLLDLAETLKGNLNIALDPIISLILKKNIDLNVFIGEELSKLTRSIVTHCDGNKIIWVISSILGQSGQLPPFKGIIAKILDLIIEKYQTNVIRLKNFPQIIVLLVQLIYDQTYSVRQIAKQGLFNLLNCQYLNREEFQDVLRKNLPEKEFQDVKKLIEKHKMLIDEKFIEGMSPVYLAHLEENSYKPLSKANAPKEKRPYSHLLKVEKI